MTGSQYKNIIQWTLFFHKDLEGADSMTVVKKILNNLGVAFPNGTLDDVIRILKKKRFLGWRPCSGDDAQKYVNLGVASIAIDSARVIILCPDHKLPNLSDKAELEKRKNENVKHLNELTDKGNDKLLFFTYSYGHKLEEP